MEICLACSYLWYNSVIKWCSLVTVKVITLCRPVDSRLEHVNFDSLLQCLTVDKLLQVFASVLLERRLILIADKLRYWCCGEGQTAKPFLYITVLIQDGWFRSTLRLMPVEGFLSIIKLTDGKKMVSTEYHVTGLCSTCWIILIRKWTSKHW